MAQKIHKPHPWWDKAIAFAKAHESWCAIEFGSPEHQAWRDYFNWLNWAPSTLRDLAENRSWTAPTRWPNDFTVSFQPAPQARGEPLVLPLPAPELPRPTQDELDAQFKRLDLSHLRPGGKLPMRPRHSADDRRQAQAALDRYAAEAQQQPQKEAAE